MGRLFLCTLATVLFVGLSTPARAQDDYFYRDWTGASFSGPQPYGGFGMQYTQVPMAGSVMMDRFGMMYTTPMISSPAPALLAQPQAPTVRARSRKAAPAPRYALPTGHLYWPGASAAALYSPALRQQNYGGGYARSPYGSIYYGGMWHGWPGY